WAVGVGGACLVVVMANIIMPERADVGEGRKAGSVCAQGRQAGMLAWYNSFCTRLAEAVALI
ncbi:MAG: hypothetical protein ACLFV4_08315, partial [Candidatus Hydrogenedentota bacterium]